MVYVNCLFCEYGRIKGGGRRNRGNGKEAGKVRVWRESRRGEREEKD